MPPNSERLPIVDTLKKFAVEIILLPLTYRGATGELNTFANVLYTFDVIKYLGKNLDVDRILILDPDCVWNRSAGSLEAVIDRHGACFYDTGYPPDQDNNGLSRRQLQEISDAMSGTATEKLPVFVGGEFYAVTAKENRRIAAAIDPYLARNDVLRAAGKPHLITEEHFYSLWARHFGYDTRLAASYIKRIWTTFRYRNAEAADLELTIWHLPSEKRTGLAALFRELRSARTRFWTIPAGDEFARYVGSFCGVPNPSKAKLAFDALDRLVARLVP